jgi:hypothetical protein
MRKIIILLVISSILVSCKSTKGHCDSYGYLDEQDNFDIHSSTSERMAKYTTSTTIK